MEGARTRGQPVAIAAIEAMLRGGVPGAILLVGPAGVGKTTLALDLAAALLCDDSDPGRRPCRACRGCRLVEAGNHPDLHRLAPSGPGAQIGIGGSDRGRGVRELISELALLAVEGGARVAIIEDAQRLSEDAQSALLKTLEEPGPGVVLVLCVDEEDRLLPTIRSRCARVRLGPVAAREIERLLVEEGIAGPPQAGQVARIAGGLPGLAIVYARSPEAQRIRAEISGRLVDLLGAGPAAGLSAVRELQTRAGELALALDATATHPMAVAAAAAPAGSDASRRRRASKVAATDALVSAVATSSAGGEPPPAELDDPTSSATERSSATRVPAAQRRRAASSLLGIWQDVARDLALVAIGERRRLRDPALLEDLETALARVSGEASPDGKAPIDEASGTGRDEARSDRREGAEAIARIGRLLRRLAGAADLLDANVAPELVLDVAIVAWTRPRDADMVRLEGRGLLARR